MTERVYCRMQLVAAIWLAVALWLIAAPTSVLANGIPQQPASPYASNINAVNAAGPPMVMWTFRQTECLSMNITEDMGTGLTISRFDNTACPSSGSFSNAVVGATSTSSTTLNALRTNTGIGSTAFSPVTTQVDGVFRSLSLALWLTPVQSLSSGSLYHMVEIADEAPGTSSAADANDQLRFYFVPGAANAAKLQVDALVNGAGNAGTPLSSGSFGTCFASGFKFTVNNSAPSDPLLNLPSSIGKKYFIGLNVQSDVSGTTLVYYAGQAGGALTNCTKTASDISVNFFAFPVTSPLRVGSTRSGQVGLPATYHSLTFYNRSLTATEMQKLFAARLPNSLPVVLAGDIVANEDDPTSIVNLNSSTIALDVDGNVVSAFRLKSLPDTKFGDLYYSGSKITNVDFLVNDSSLLTFRQSLAQANNFSIISGSTCPNSAFATFDYVATDGLCDLPTTPASDVNCNSPKNATARICVLDQADAPTSQDSLANTVRAGSFLNFTLVPQDNDDFRVGLSDTQVSNFRMRELTGSFAPNAKIEFNKTVGDFGSLYSWNGATCGNTVLAANTPLSFVTIAGVTTFSFCYNVSSNPGGASAADIGFDTFGFRFRDNGGTIGPFYGFKVTVTNPLVACPPTPPVAINTLNGLDGDVCTSIGDESVFNDTKLVPIYLQGQDSVGGRTMTFKVTRLPSHGTLYVNNGTGGTLSMGTLVDGATVIPTITGTAANLVYVGNVDYFNKIERPVTFLRAPQPYANNEDKGIDGCALQTTTCRCGITTSPGCPDTFEYKVFAGSGTSVNATYSVHLRSRPSNFTMVAPDQITYSTGQRFTFTGDATIRIVDSDDDAYMVSVVLNALPGTFGLSDPVLTDPEFFFVSGGNCLNNGCQSEIEFWTTVSKANRALAALYFSYAGTWKPENTLLVSVYKPQPNGTSADIAQLPSKIRNSVLKAQLKINVASPPSTAPAQGNGLEIAIIAGASAAGFLALVCFINACVWFVRKSRRAAKAARKSLASHRSKRQSQQLAALEDEERQSSAKSTGNDALCCACLFGSSGKDEQDEEIDRAALAQHRQSAVSQRSHHSTRSVGNRQSQGAGALEASAPTRGREVVAPSMDGQELQVADDSVFAWEKHIDRRTGDVYFFNPRTGVSQWDPPTIKVKRTGK